MPADTYLHLNVQNADPLLLCNGLHGLLASTIAVAPELSMLDKPILGDQFLETLLVCEVVGLSVLLTGARGTSSVYTHAQKTLASVHFEDGGVPLTTNGESELIGKLRKESLQNCGFTSARGA
jgi:hypothetical protein